MFYCFNLFFVEVKRNGAQCDVNLCHISFTFFFQRQSSTQRSLSKQTRRGRCGLRLKIASNMSRMLVNL